MKEGDYKVKGMEDFLVIERKKTTGELCKNLGQLWKQFNAEMGRMETYVHKYIICEFPLDDIDRFPEGSGIPRRKWKYMRINGGLMRKRLFEQAEYYGIEVIFCRDRSEAEDKAIELIQKAIRDYNERS